MGGIYPKPEKTVPNSRSSAGFPNENQQLNETNFPNVLYSNALGATSRASHTDFGGVFTRTLPSGLPNNQTSFSIPGQRGASKGNEEILGYRYFSDSAAFQPRNMSMSPNAILQNQFKHQNYNPSNLMSTLNQNRSAAVLQQLSAATNNDSFQNNQMNQAGSKLNVDVSNRNKPSNFSINQQPHIQQSGLFPQNKRPQLLSQPPNKRARLTNDFVNIAHHSPTNIQQGHHLPMNQQDNIRVSSSPQKFSQKDSTIYKGSLLNQPKSHLLDQRGVWQNKEPAYYPEVEAISPVPEDMRHCDIKAFTEKDDIGDKLRVVDADIIKQEQNISRLQEKIDSLNSKINQPSNENYSKEEETLIPLSRDPIQSIITDNQRKATEQHQLFHKLCSTHVLWSPLALPLYRQQTDVELLMKVKTNFHKTFKPHLIKYIRKRKFADRARMRYLADSYEVKAKAWYKRLDKSLNSSKRRQKEAKFRELFEKIFPEIKRIREEKERDIGDYADSSSAVVGENSANVSSNGNSHRCLHTNLNVNGANDNQRPNSPYDAVKEMEKMKEYAIDPPLTTPPWNKDYNLIESGCLIKDPKSKHSNFQNYKPFWSREEIDTFKEQYIISPKNFARIASFLQRKSVSECVHYYYLTKKSVNYKALVKKHARRRRDKVERQQRYHQSHQNTGDNIVPSTSYSTDGPKIEPLLSKNFMEFNSLMKEEQQNNIYNPDVDPGNMSRGQEENENICNVEDNKSTTNSMKNLKTDDSSCSEPQSFTKNQREPDNDGDDNNYRGTFSNESNRIPEGSRASESDRNSSNDNGRDRTGDTSSENVRNSSRQLQDSEAMPKINKHEILHIKDAIEYSIEQTLSQNIESNINKVFEKNPAITSNNLFGLTGINIDESIWKKSNMIDNLDNLKSGYFQQKNGDTSIFQDVKKETENGDGPIRFNSSFNRAILMKDFCTAQMMNQIPVSSPGTSKIQTTFPISSNTHSINPSRSLMVEQLPIAESFKSKTSSTTESVDAYIANISTHSKILNSSTKKSDFFIDRVSKLYEEEVEPYTDKFRNRSDSQRTRTSSEASEMYEYIKNRNQKNILSPKKQSGTNYSDDKTQNVVVDSRIKMPPPDVTDQKVFRSQKSSFSSKRNLYSKSNISQETKEDTLSSTASTNENIIKRKIITAANIIDSLTDQHTSSDSDVKVIQTQYKPTEKPISRVIDLLEDKFCHISSVANNSQITLDGHIKQLIVDDYDSTKLSDQIVNNKSDTGQTPMKTKCENKHKSTMPLKKREKPILVDISSPHKSKGNYKSASDESGAGATKALPEKNNNTLNYKERSDFNNADSYDLQFNSPGNLLIDLDNNTEGL